MRPRARVVAPVVRAGAPEDADALFALISAHQVEGHLLPRELAELRRRAPRFVVAVAGGRLVACAELAPLSSSTAEIRSLVVAPETRGRGVAGRLVGALRAQAVRDGFTALCAFTHDARLLLRHNFSLVPHPWIPEKIARDCGGCPLFRRCGQHAMLLPLKETDRHDANVVEERRVRVA
jgi:amino-acid N-acetyltransferase